MSAAIDREPINILDKKLQVRGIHHVAQDHGWEIKASGWRYPTYTPEGKDFTLPDGRRVFRWKNQDSNAKPKYLWEPKEAPARPTYYILPGTLQAIAKASGLVYLASGEPDVLAYHAAGIGNVLCWFGEQHKPKNLADDLRSFGVTSVECFPDLDNAGENWARFIVTQLDASGIEVRVYELPSELGEKGDINKLWRVCDFNADRFLERLIALPPMEVKPDPKPAPKPTIKPLPDTSEPPPDLWRAIEQALGASKYGPDGWSEKNLRCPYAKHEHDDKKPAFGLNNKTWSGKCFKCGESKGWKATAEALGIQVADYLKNKPVLKLATAATEPGKPLAERRADRYKAYTIDEMAARPPEKYLTSEIPAASLGMLVGPSGAGKSFVARDYALQVGNCVYVAAEGAGGTADRFIAARNHYKVDDSKVRVIDSAVPLLDPGEVQTFIQAIQPLAPKLIIFDTLARCMLGGDENSARDAGLLIEACDLIKRATGATVLLVHHTGKSGTSERGSSAFKAACDFVIELTNEDGLITLACGKSKDSKPFENKSLRMIEAPARDGRTSIVLIPAGSVRHSASDPLSQLQKQMLEALALETFINTGAKASNVKEVVNVANSTLYRVLSNLIRRDYVRQATKGDPYTITGAGLKAIGRGIDL